MAIYQKRSAASHVASYSRPSDLSFHPYTIRPILLAVTLTSTLPQLSRPRHSIAQKTRRRLPCPPHCRRPTLHAAAAPPPPPRPVLLAESSQQLATIRRPSAASRAGGCLQLRRPGSLRRPGLRVGGSGTPVRSALAPVGRHPRTPPPPLPASSSASAAVRKHSGAASLGHGGPAPPRLRPQPSSILPP